MLAIPAYAARQGTTACTAGVAGIEVAFYRPVVRHVEPAPL